MAHAWNSSLPQQTFCITQLCLSAKGACPNQSMSSAQTTSSARQDHWNSEAMSQTICFPSHLRFHKCALYFISVISKSNFPLTTIHLDECLGQLPSEYNFTWPHSEVSLYPAFPHLCECHHRQICTKINKKRQLFLYTQHPSRRTSSRYDMFMSHLTMVVVIYLSGSLSD